MDSDGGFRVDRRRLRSRLKQASCSFTEIEPLFYGGNSGSNPLGDTNYFS